MAKHYDKQFKLDAIRYYHDHRELGLQGCASNLGISHQTLSRWQKELRDTGDIESRGSGNYVSDEADFKSILEWRNNTEGPFFMFNVTMQNHSNYGGDFDNFDPQIVAKFKNTYSNKYLNKYLSLMYETDQDVASLLSELSQSDRKTIVVFWGDHQPNDYVVRPIYKEYGLDFDNQTYEQQQQRQKTPFFIWANYDIQEQTNVEISLNYLNILLFETAGLQLDEYQTFRKNLWQGQIPMMNAVGYRNDDGDLVEYDDAPEEIQNLLNEYQNIQYYRMEREYSKKK